MLVREINLSEVRSFLAFVVCLASLLERSNQLSSVIRFLRFLKVFAYLPERLLTC